MERLNKLIRPLIGWVAQLVEQRTENPCVAGSIPALATTLNIHPQSINCVNQELLS
ncbi:MAG: hypothetical protein K0R02_767 [Rickettsiaceae bacterium]|nr:hypothetical protein [Rickettsiaceae bacterium]